MLLVSINNRRILNQGEDGCSSPHRPRAALSCINPLSIPPSDIAKRHPIKRGVLKAKGRREKTLFWYRPSREKCRCHPSTQQLTVNEVRNPSSSLSRSAVLVRFASSSLRVPIVA